MHDNVLQPTGETQLRFSNHCRAGEPLEHLYQGGGDGQRQAAIAYPAALLPGSNTALAALAIAALADLCWTERIVRYALLLLS